MNFSEHVKIYNMENFNIENMLYLLVKNSKNLSYDRVLILFRGFDKIMRKIKTIPDIITKNRKVGN